MKLLPDWLRSGYLRLIDPVADALVRRGVAPNTITTIGTLCAMASGVLYAAGWIRTGGWVMGLTALFDVLDGTVARRSGRSTAFGAFYDSTLDRVADGFVLGGFAVFFATRPGGWSLAMVVVSVLGLIGSYVLGVDASGGVLQRPERVVLLSAPQAFFGLALDGFVLSAILVLLTVTAWLTAAQRIRAVYRAMDRRAASDARGE